MSASQQRDGPGGERPIDLGPAGVPTEVQLGIERLFALEVYLLDARRFAEWLDLFTDDAMYVVSMREVVQPGDDGRPSIAIAEPPLISERRDFLSTRVRRLDTRLAHAEQPPSLTRHLVTNVLVLRHENDEADVASNFQVYQARVDISEHVFHGQRVDTLRRVDGTWRIARRHAMLDASLVPRTISIFF